MLSTLKKLFALLPAAAFSDGPPPLREVVAEVGRCSFIMDFGSTQKAAAMLQYILLYPHEKSVCVQMELIEDDKALSVQVEHPGVDVADAIKHILFEGQRIINSSDG